MTDTVIVRVSGNAATPAEPSPQRAELTRSTLSGGESHDMANEKVFLYINDGTDALCYVLQADSYMVSPVPMMGADR